MVVLSKVHVQNVKHKAEALTIKMASKMYKRYVDDVTTG